MAPANVRRGQFSDAGRRSKQNAGALLTALRHLPDRQREVIALRVFLDLDIDTIAAHLEIAPGTVRVHLSRAMTTLRHELSPSQAMEAG